MSDCFGVEAFGHRFPPKQKPLKNGGYYESSNNCFVLLLVSIVICIVAIAITITVASLFLKLSNLILIGYGICSACSKCSK